MADHQQWLDAGLATLEQDGARALTIEHLADQVGLSKGSFYHHFGGMPGFRTALLGHYEATYTAQYIDAVEADPRAAPMAKITHLIDLVCKEDDDDQNLETGLRAWALQDAEVHQALERVDRRRVDYLRGLWLELTGDDEQAAVMSRLLYLILVGAGHVIPPVPPGELLRIYQFTLGLVSAEPVSRPTRRGAATA